MKKNTQDGFCPSRVFFKERIHTLSLSLSFSFSQSFLRRQSKNEKKSYGNRVWTPKHNNYTLTKLKLKCYCYQIIFLIYIYIPYLNIFIFIFLIYTYLYIHKQPRLPRQVKVT